MSFSRRAGRRSRRKRQQVTQRPARRLGGSKLQRAAEAQWRSPQPEAPPSSTPVRDWSEHPADIRLILGSTGTGKTWYARRVVDAWREGPVRIWDPMRQHRPATASMAEFADSEAPRLAFRPVSDLARMRAQFSEFCRFCWLQQHARAAADRMLVIVEECANLHAQTGRPCAAWRRLVVQGRARGFVLVATSQRPAFIDTDLRSQATYIRAGRNAYPDEAAAVARLLPGVQSAQIMRLHDRQAFEFRPRSETEPVLKTG